MFCSEGSQALPARRSRTGTLETGRSVGSDGKWSVFGMKQREAATILGPSFNINIQTMAKWRTWCLVSLNRKETGVYNTRCTCPPLSLRCTSLSIVFWRYTEMLNVTLWLRWYLKWIALHFF